MEFQTPVARLRFPMSRPDVTNCMSGTSAPFRIRSTRRFAPFWYQTLSTLLEHCAWPSSKALRRRIKTNTVRTMKHPLRPCRSTRIPKPECVLHAFRPQKKLFLARLEDEYPIADRCRCPATASPTMFRAARLEPVSAPCPLHSQLPLQNKFSSPDAAAIRASEPAQQGAAHASFHPHPAWPQASWC